MAKDVRRAGSVMHRRGNSICRGCSGKNLFSALNLGELPIANELHSTHRANIELFPLELSICNDCGLGQVADVVDPERLFGDYRYLSSTSSTFVEHSRHFVQSCANNRLLMDGDWVLEIACNDGYLLEHFQALGVPVLGIEPARNVAELSRNKGITTISEFFDSELARRVLEDRGFPKLIVANNVMAHVPDLMDFVRGLAILCGPQTLISVENPSLTNIFQGFQFDTIYHEHFSYLSATSVSNLCKQNGLSLFDIERIPTHGTSNRYWIRRSMPSSEIYTSVESACNAEFAIGLFASEKWELYSRRVFHVVHTFREWLLDETAKGKTIYGYGAAAKASTLLNLLGIDAKKINSIADASEEKQKRFMPPLDLPIISPFQLKEANPDNIVIFPWNICDEIRDLLQSQLELDSELWIAIPSLKRI